MEWLDNDSWHLKPGNSIIQPVRNFSLVTCNYDGNHQEYILFSNNVWRESQFIKLWKPLYTSFFFKTYRTDSLCVRIQFETLKNPWFILKEYSNYLHKLQVSSGQNFDFPRMLKVLRFYYEKIYQIITSSLVFEIFSFLLFVEYFLFTSIFSSWHVISRDKRFTTLETYLLDYYLDWTHHPGCLVLIFRFWLVWLVNTIHR